MSGSVRLEAGGRGELLITADGTFRARGADGGGERTGRVDGALVRRVLGGHGEAPAPVEEPAAARRLTVVGQPGHPDRQWTDRTAAPVPASAAALEALLDQLLAEPGAPAALPAALAAVEAGHLADRVFVVRRGTQALESVYANELGADGRWVRPARADRAVVAERGRPWDAVESAGFRRQLAVCERRAHDPRIPEDWALAVGRDAERAAALAEPVRRTAQPLRRAPGVDYHRLSADEHRFVFEAMVVPTMLNAVIAQESPVVVYVAGQPGSGKTRAAHLVHRSVNEPVHLAGDDFKVLHPDYLQLLRSDPRRASEPIRADYRAWQAEAEAYVRERRGNVVIETTPADPATFAAEARKFRRAGYRVELLVLAVRAADSRQGTAHRYARLSGRGLPARFTNVAGHDVHYRVLPDVVAAAEELAAVDQVTVMRRDTSALHSSRPTSGGRQAGRRAAAPALLAERARPYTEEEAARFWAVQRELHTAMPQYRDDLVAIGALALPFMPAARRLRRLEAPTGPAALPAHPQDCDRELV